MKSARWFLCLSIGLGLLVSTATSSAGGVGVGTSGAFVFGLGYYDLGPVSAVGPTVSDNTLRITNPGTSDSSLCANIYVFDTNQNMLACCSCQVSQDGLLTLSVLNNLLGGSTSVKSGVIKILSSSGSCNPTSATASGELSAWLSHWAGPETVTEQPLSPADLSAGELTGLKDECSSTKSCRCPAVAVSG